MANEVTFKIKIDDNGGFKKVTMDATELGRAVRSVQDEAEKTRRSIISWSNAAQAFDVMQNAIGELQGVITDLTSAYQVQLVAETQLNTIMRQRMNATDEEIQSIKDLCSAQQELGVIGDEVQLSGAQQMATFLNNKQSLDVLIPAMNNLVAQQNGLNATNQDAVSIGNMMGKAMQGQVEVLQRVGITFDESQKKVLQFGTESERAAMLAEVITENVGNMNAELAKTDAGKWKQTENYLGDIKEQLGGMVQAYAPTITFLSQASVAATGIGKLATSFYSVTQAIGLTKVAGELWNATSVRINALTTACSATMRGAAVSASTLRLALQGLMIVTGVGVAIAALTEAINYLYTSSANAAGNVDNLSEAEQRAKQAHEQTAQQIASVRSEMDLNIAKLKDFSGSKEQEKTLVQQMNAKYGEALGYYSTVSQWYQALTANSEAYCNQMINEIRLRDLANRAAKLDQKRHDIKYNADGTLRKYSTKNKTRTKTTGQVDAGDGKVIPIKQEVEEKGTSQLAQANKQMTSLYQQSQNVRKQMQQIVTANNKIKTTKVKGWSPTPPPAGGGSSKGGGTATTPGTTTTDTAKPAPLQGSIDWYQQQISDLNEQLTATADAGLRKNLQTTIEGFQRELGMLKVEAGIDVVPKIEVKKDQKSIIEQIDEEIADFNQNLDPIVIDVEGAAALRDLDKLQQLNNIDLTNFIGVQNALQNIKTITDPTAKGFAAAGASCEALGGALQQLGADSAAAKAGMLMAAIGQLVLSFAQAMTSASSNWVTWLAFGISGTAQLISIIGTMSQFATGGIVGGNQKSGDNVLVRVNSGEMILNAAQQARLFALANGAATQVATGFNQGLALPQVTVQSGKLQGLISDDSAPRQIDVRMKVRGRDIVVAAANETRSNRRRSNIKI
nr:MAG TPA: Putative tail length tape measure protein [Caudoviricetes sp.]